MCNVHESKYIESCSILEGFECCACCIKSKEGCSHSQGEYDEIGSKLSRDVYKTVLRRIGNGYKGFPFEDKEIAIMIAEKEGINIDKYPELLVVRDIFMKCSSSKNYENFIRMTVKEDILEQLDYYLESVADREKINYKVSI